MGEFVGEVLGVNYAQHLSGRVVAQNPGRERHGRANGLKVRGEDVDDLTANVPAPARLELFRHDLRCASPVKFSVRIS